VPLQQNRRRLLWNALQSNLNATELFRDDWVVYSKQPFGGSEHVLHYLARYTHRVAISNHRLLDVTDGEVTFRWKDYAHHNKCRKMTLTHEEFLRRFLQHVLPRGFPRIRYFGFLANRHRGLLLPLCRGLLNVCPPPPVTASTAETAFHPCPRCRSPPAKPSALYRRFQPCK